MLAWPKYYQQMFYDSSQFLSALKEGTCLPAYLAKETRESVMGKIRNSVGLLYIANLHVSMVQGH